ncbi:MAG: hypothetical protein M3Z98_00590 [Candidatus Dormibacteraeota bacterium]|nr:hypothetical protein [Candidatus Dormibacteraeota bacterium]
MRTATTVRPSWLHTGAVQLGASIRGVVYGFALLVAVPQAWTAGKPLVAFLIGLVVLFGIVVEAVTHIRGDHRG